MRDSLCNPGGKTLALDDSALVRRREYMASTWGSEPKWVGGHFGHVGRIWPISGASGQL